MSEHTKTPWKVEEGVHGFPDIVSEDCGEIVGCEGFYSELDRDWANARHIVHCVNNYERLVEILGRIVDGDRGVDAIYKSSTLLAELEAEKGGEL